jgi:hypothetical protein
MNDYLQTQRAKQEQISREHERLNKFEKAHRSEIENGLTKREYLTKYGLMDGDLYDTVKADVDIQRANEEAFLKGFNSVPIATYNH